MWVILQKKSNKMKKIAVFTTTRAEFGILLPLINELNICKTTELLLFVGGTHLAREHGKTISEIRQNNISITATFDYLLNEDTPKSLVKSIAIETIELANIFDTYKFDAVCILGDRYELLPIIQTAIIFRKVIIHIHGGERTEGAIDEQIRHIITKAAHIHFAACEEYAQNIKKLGEPKQRVFNTGALAVDNMKKINNLSKQELFINLKLKTDMPTVLLTYHPVTLEFETSPKEQIVNLFEALENTDIQLVVTAPNIDANQSKIIETIKKYVEQNKNYHYFNSLGVKNYLSLIPHCEYVIGNSSSGIIEVPFFKIPTINIGERQKGRIQHKSIINTDYSKQSIINGIKKSYSTEFRNSLQEMKYKFGEGNTAKKMVSIINKIEINKNLLQKKLVFAE